MKKKRKTHSRCNFLMIQIKMRIKSLYIHKIDKVLKMLNNFLVRYRDKIKL